LSLLDRILGRGATQTAAPSVGDVVPRQALIEAHARIRRVTAEAERHGERADALESVLSTIGDPDALLPFATRQAQGLFRAIGKGKETDRDLNTFKRSEILRLAHQAFAFRGDAHNILESMIDFIIGDGFAPKAQPLKDGKPNEALQQLLDALWEDPKNRLEDTHEAMVRSYLLEGERFALAELSEQDGRLEIAYVRPEKVTGVIQDNRGRDVLIAVERGAGQEPWEYFVLDNLTDEIEIERKPEDQQGNRYVITETLVDSGGAKTTVMRSVRGLALAWFANRPEGGSRGRSELAEILDYIAAHDELVWAQVQREKLLNLFVMDVSIEGVTNKEDIDAKLKEMGLLKAPENPKVVAHNDKVTVQMIKPELSAGTKNELERTLAVNIYGAKGMPEHFRGSGGDSNLATAQAQDVLPMKRLRRKQKQVSTLFKKLITIQLELQVRAGVADENTVGEFEIVSTEVGGKDKQRGTTIIKDLIAAISVAVTDQVLKPEAANAILIQALREGGWEVRDEWAELPEGADMAIVEKMLAELAGRQKAESEPDREPRGDPRRVSRAA